jgi:tRNA dimethylallyltransferase
MPLHIVSLEPEQRSELHQRIADRFQAMVTLGFLEEVRKLRARPDLHAELPSMRCVGYRQAWEALDALESSNAPKVAGAPGDPDPTWQARGIAATRQLAKRQLTWLRSMPERQVVACDAPTALEQVLHQADLTWGGQPE